MQKIQAQLLTPTMPPTCRTANHLEISSFICEVPLTLHQLCRTGDVLSRASENCDGSQGSTGKNKAHHGEHSIETGPPQSKNQHDANQDHCKGTIFHHHRLHVERSCCPYKSFGCHLEVIAFFCDSTQILATKQKIIYILMHNPSHLAKAMIQSVQGSGGIRVSILIPQLLDRSVKMNEVVRLLNGINA